MALLDQVKADQLAARKARELVIAASLTTLIGDLEKKQKDQGSITDAEVVAIVKKHLDGVRENIKLVDPSLLIPLRQEELALSKYIPVQITGESLANTIAGIISALTIHGDTNQGAVMKVLKEHFGGQYDGKEASQLVKETLTK